MCPPSRSASPLYKDRLSRECDWYDPMRVGRRHDVNLFEILGFTWDRDLIPDTVPIHSVERSCFRFHRMLPEFVWDAGVPRGKSLYLS